MLAPVFACAFAVVFVPLGVFAAVCVGAVELLITAPLSVAEPPVIPAWLLIPVGRPAFMVVPVFVPLLIVVPVCAAVVELRLEPLCPAAAPVATPV